jgi:uncharacterized protein (TIGR03083 family)
MPDDSHLAGIDPYAAWDREAARLADHLRGRPDDDAEWDAPSECEGWTVRDVLAHLLAEQEYFAACLSGDVADLMQRFGEKGATDLDSFNSIGIALVADRSPSELLAEWIEQDERNRAGFRDRGDSDVDSSVGAYSGRWQAFHLASELATHADDIHVPDDADRAERTAWRAPFSRFAVTESHPHLSVEVTGPGRTRVHGDGIDVELDDETLVAAVAGRSSDPTLTPLNTSG